MPNNVKDEDEIIDHWRKGRRFNVRNTRDWMDLIVKTVAVGAMVVTSTVFAARTLAPDWANMPKTLAQLSVEVSALRQQIETQAPQLIEYKGSIITAYPVVAQGNDITLTSVQRLNVGCSTNINVRFFDHSDNTIVERHSYILTDVKTPVSRQFAPYSFRVFIPSDLAPGTYSYLPEIIPVDCGIYRPIIAPMSFPFEVTQR